MQFYLYDIASLDHWDIGADGFYGNPQRIESFWDKGRYDKFLIKVDGTLAGFALTTSTSDGSEESPHEVQELFVLRRYRRAGVGRMVASRLFENFAGIWQVSVMASNTPAQEFWARVIKDLTGEDPCEFTVNPSPEDQVMFRFTTHHQRPL